jgi:protein ImuB
MALDAAARRAALRTGMPAAKAQALVPGLIMRNADPAADARALDRLAIWALQRYAPVAAADPPDGLVVDTTGAAHLHGGEDAMLVEMVARLAASGITARAAIADSWGAAHAFARTMTLPTLVIPAGDSAKAILGLPIAALRLPKTMVEDLSVLGLALIGELAAKPRAPLTLRFGPELCRRLDQAMGRLSEPIDPVRPPDLIEVRRVFAEPIGAAETIARYTGKLTGQLCEALEAKGLGARQLDLLLYRVDNRIEAVRIGTARPVRDVKRLTRLLCDKIETIDPGFGIELMRLAVLLVEPLAPKQMISSLTEEPEADVSGLIDTLANRVGEQRLYRFSPVASDVTLGSENRAGGARYWRDLARPLAAPRAPVAETGADRDARLAARPSARQFHLARHKAARDMRRWPRAGFWGMVETGRRALHSPRLFPG